MNVEESLVVVVDGNPVLEYHRNRGLSEVQRQALDRMDAQMDGGIPLEGKWVDLPDLLQRAQFVARQLADALDADNEPLAAATLAWLGERIPDLRQVEIRHRSFGVAIHLISDRPYAPESPVQFHPPRKGGE